MSPALALGPQTAPRDLPTCETIEVWRTRVGSSLYDEAELQAAVAPIFAAWEDFKSLAESSPGLSESQALGGVCCGRLVADLGGLDLYPDGVTRLDALRTASAWARLTPRIDRLLAAQIEADLIEDLMFEGLRDEFLSRLERVRTDFEEFPGVVAEVLLMGANLREVSGEFAAALDWAEEAQRLVHGLAEDDFVEDYVPVLAGLVHAKIYTHIGVLDEANRYLEQARMTARQLGESSTRPMVVIAETELAQARGDRAWVLEHLASALANRVFEDYPDMQRSMELELLQARAQLALQEHENLGEARAALIEAVENLGLEDSQSWSPALLAGDLELALGNVAAAREWVDRVGGAIDVSTEWIPLLVRSQRAGVLGRVLLRSSEVAPSELASAIALGERALDDLLRAWESIPHRSGGVGFLHFDVRRELLATLGRLYATSLGPESGGERLLEVLLDVEARGSLAEFLGASDATLSHVRNRLIPDRGGMLIFVPSASGSIALTLDEAGTRTWDLPRSDDWEQAADRLAHEMQPSAALDSQSAERSRILAGAVRDLVLPIELDRHVSGWDAIVFVRAENMGWIPFEALPLEGRNGALLGLELATCYLPSLRVGLGLSERAIRERTVAPEFASSERVLYVVGPIGTATESVRTIPWNDADQDLVTAPWARGEVLVETNPTLALKRMMHAGSDGRELTVVVSHGRRDGNQETTQGFGFDASHPVFASELETMRSAPLTVLLVCGAGAGHSRRGDDLGSHLGAAFLVSGAQVVASSREDLSLEASLQLLDTFQQELARGHAPAHALRTARTALAQQGKWAHPSFFSNLTLTGLGFDPPSQRLVEAAGAAGDPRATAPLAWLLLAMLAVAAVAASRRWIVRASTR